MRAQRRAVWLVVGLLVLSACSLFRSAAPPERASTRQPVTFSPSVTSALSTVSSMPSPMPTRPLATPTEAPPPPSPSATAPVDVQAVLHRPLHVPTLAAGSACPSDPAHSVSPDFGPALGAGPIYPVIGQLVNGVLRGWQVKEDGGWYYIKVLWIGSPDYKGSVLIRGHQIDGPNEMRFESYADPADEIAFPAGGGGSTPHNWRNWPSYTRLRDPGCYAYQVDGLDFSYTIIFQAA